MEGEPGFINNEDLQQNYYNVYWNAIQGSDLAVQKKQIIAKAFNKFVKGVLAFADQYQPGTVITGDETDDLFRNIIYEKEQLQDAVVGVPRDPLGNFNTWMVTEIPKHAFPELMNKLFSETRIPGTMQVNE